MALSFDTTEAELEHYRSRTKSLEDDLEDTKLALDEFRATAGELEKELENELAIAEKQLKATQGREEALQSESKYQAALREHTKTMTHMQGEVDELRKSSEEYRKMVRDMELDNDELEGRERMVSSSLEDVETKYGKAIERITLLEDDLIEKSKLEEECQRLRDDLREMTEEVGVLRTQARPLTPVNPLPLPVADPGPSDLFTRPSSPLPPRSHTMLSLSPERRRDLTPRKRVVSNAVESPSQKPSMLPRSISSGSAIFSQSTRIPRPPPLSDSPARVPSPGGSRIPTPKDDLASSRLARSTHVRDLHSVASSASPAGPSHLATLRAETRRMRGLTHRLVSTRNLREVSAIPVPKTVTPSGPSTDPALGKSILGRSVSRRAPGPGPSRTRTPRRSLVASPISPPPDSLRASRPPSRASRTSISSSDASHRPQTPTSRQVAVPKAVLNYSRPTSSLAGQIPVSQVAPPEGRRKSLGPNDKRMGFGFGFGGARIAAPRPKVDLGASIGSAR